MDAFCPETSRDPTDLCKLLHKRRNASLFNCFHGQLELVAIPIARASLQHCNPGRQQTKFSANSDNICSGPFTPKTTVEPKMVSQDAVIPIATLSAIVVLGMIFIVWWFPRTWMRGNKEERAIMDAERRGREAYLANLRAQQRVNRDEETGDESDKPPMEHEEVRPPPYAVTMPKGYVPPVTMY